MKNNINLEGRMYRVGQCVYLGYIQMNVYEQRGRKYVNYKRRQVNLNDIPILPQYPDPVHDYIFNGLSATHPCHAMDYWIKRYRMKHQVTHEGYKIRYINCRRA